MGDFDFMYFSARVTSMCHTSRFYQFQQKKTKKQNKTKQNNDYANLK